MKRMSLIISTVFVLSLLLINISPAQAYLKPNNSLPDPTAIGISGDMSFDISVSEPANLPGSVAADDLISPAGFPAKEEQFIGKELVLANHDYGQVEVCFTFPSSAEGWTGNVYLWDGSKWQKQVTNLVAGGEDAPRACADVYGNGQFALIGGLTSPQQRSLPDCWANPFSPYPGMPYASLIEDITPFGSGIEDKISFVVYDESHDPESGGYVSAKVSGITPPGSFTGTLSGSGYADVTGTTDVLIDMFVAAPGDSTSTLTIIVDNKCKEVLQWGGVD